MAEKRSKRHEEKRPQPTVQHESSADNAQDLGIHQSAEAKKENVNSSPHRRKRSGSDGADQERGSNH